VTVLLAIGTYWMYSAIPNDPLSGLDSNHQLSPMETQLVALGFCMSPAVDMLLTDRPEDGDIENEDYVQSSIYAMFYSLYKQVPLVNEFGVKYQFTFNTWGFSPTPKEYDNDPQRHGKSAYHNLVTQPPALEYIAKNIKPGNHLEIVEIGCGTGAGANLISRQVHPTANYLALDMQAAAIDTCKTRHATPDNPNLTCQLVPNGVGHGGNQAPRADSSVDFVVISETHIADVEIGDLEKEIFAEIRRILKPGGLFLWGNALPTRVWIEADPALNELGFERIHQTNHTKGAVVARDEDYARVELVLDGFNDHLYAMKLPYFGKKCAVVTRKLIANFFRHPGTNMYKTMVTGYDSYMQQAWVNNK